MLSLSPSYHHKESKLLEGGLDEAGRGPLFGRVYAAVVIWPKELKTIIVTDSKKLKTTNGGKIREAYDFVKEHAVDWSVGYADEREIDILTISGEGGILEATRRAMHKAIDGLMILPDFLIIDGTQSNFKVYTDRTGRKIPYETATKGDAKYLSIAAASILAKVDHDNYIAKMCDDYPILEHYGLRSNVGYSAPAHLEALKKYGATPFHRLSFKRCNNAKKNIGFKWNDKDFDERRGVSYVSKCLL